MPKTAIITPFGLYEFLRMPFGLKNSAQAFQRLMDTVCQGLDCVFVYIDDILVASRNAAEHKIHLRQLFQRLQDNDLVINVAKCQFGRTEIDFLGHRITRYGATPLPDKVEAINQFKQPDTVKGLQEFVGMVNFYHRFIPDAAKILQPLSAATATKAKILQWNDTMVQAFQEAKTALASAIMLTHPRRTAPTSLTVDASDLAVGAVLQQLVHGCWQPLAFFSKQLCPPERKYSAFDRELLALYLGIRHFRYFLEGRDFIAYTDHKPLTICMAKTSDPWSSQQQRHLSYISEFTTDIRHIKGTDNHVADALSRAMPLSMPSMMEWTMLQWQPASGTTLPYKHIAQRSPACKWRIFLLVRTGRRSSATPPQDNQGPLSQLVGGAKYLMWFMAYPTPQYGRHNNSWLENLSGVDCASR